MMIKRSETVWMVGPADEVPDGWVVCHDPAHATRRGHYHPATG
jgi:hypothetical protein